MTIFLAHAHDRELYCRTDYRKAMPVEATIVRTKIRLSGLLPFKVR